MTEEEARMHVSDEKGYIEKGGIDKFKDRKSKK